MACIIYIFYAFGQLKLPIVKQVMEKHQQLGPCASCVVQWLFVAWRLPAMCSQPTNQLVAGRWRVLLRIEPEVITDGVAPAAVSAAPHHVCSVCIYTVCDLLLHSEQTLYGGRRCDLGPYICVRTYVQTLCLLELV